LPKYIKRGSERGIEISKINGNLLLVDIDVSMKATMEIVQRGKPYFPKWKNLAYPIWI
jgi:hypothetical protein